MFFGDGVALQCCETLATPWLVVSSEQCALGLAASVEGAARLIAGCGGGHGRPDRGIGTGYCMIMLLLLANQESRTIVLHGWMMLARP